MKVLGLPPGIQRLALALVKKWMGIVKGNEMRLQNHNEKLSGEDEGESEEDKERSKRRKESKKDLRGKDKNSSSRKSDQGSSVESKKKRKNTEDVEVKKMKKRTPDMASVQNLNSKNSSKPSSDGMSNSDFSDVKLDVDDDFLSKITKSKSERPKTVKTFNSKFRSTGLLEEPSKQPVTLKNSKKKEASLQRLSPAMKKEEFSQPIAPPSVSPPSSEKESNSQTASSDDQQDKVKEKHKSSSSKRKVMLNKAHKEKYFRSSLRLPSKCIRSLDKTGVRSLLEPFANCCR
ncbi:unnamed protein product [Darwinula stevensoni]|uniref:Uncharacterized protein n=1 Tax=Darwinula stevensoni TaxID=69355 RepID=A0A7R8X5L8_9CRUS|nr:unnamed protein product [Darwinula stevensoni]CAG0884929.1 unnamed protein product [Darwinula stevensoni]